MGMGITTDLQLAMVRWQLDEIEPDNPGWLVQLQDSAYDGDLGQPRLGTEMFEDRTLPRRRNSFEMAMLRDENLLFSDEDSNDWAYQPDDGFYPDN